MSKMSPAEEIFFAALEKATPGEQAAYLDAACAGQPELRARVEKLLAAHPRAGCFLEPGTAGDATGAHPANKQSSTSDLQSPSPGALVAGKYKLLQQIGEGGMGTVWMADQTEPIKRRVAVKLIRVDRGNSATILARFEAERQAIALMDHPHIAKLLDAGTTEAGQPYFIMELVKGVPLNEYCDTHKLSIQDRLGLFQLICSAVQHAHQKGIIHRDLKPTNILVESHDGEPVPKVIDFGLAKATSGLQLTEHTMFTAFGSVMGTPLYMAPEQANFNAIDVDTRADIYALGVLLYELLTGTTPLTRDSVKKAALDEMLKLVREQEAPTPSSRLSSEGSSPSVAANRQTEPAKLGRFVKGELDWIVLKALSKERDRRYETANGFAKDIERFLNHEPVAAGPPSVRYKLRKFVRRNRGQVLAGLLVLVTLLIGIAGTTTGLIRAEYRRRDAEDARWNEAEQRQLAQTKQQEAQTEKARAENAEAETLADYRASTDDVIELLIGSKPELGPHEKAYVEKTLKRWQEFAARKDNDQHSRDIRSEGHFNVGVLWQKLGQKEEARTEYQAARNLKQALVDEFPGIPRYKRGLAGARHNLAVLLVDSGKDEDARKEYEAVRDLRKMLVEQFPTRAAYQQDLAHTHNNLGHLFDRLGETNKARIEYRAGLALLSKLIHQFPSRQDFRQDLARTQENLGIMLIRANGLEAGRAEFLAALDVWDELCAQFPRVPEHRQQLANTHNNLGTLLRDLGKTEDGLVELLSCLRLRKRLAEEFPAIRAYRQEVAHSHHGIGLLLADLGQFDKAQSEYQTARAIQKKLLLQFPEVSAYQDDLSITHKDLGTLLRHIGKREEALAELQLGGALQKTLVDRFPSIPSYQQQLARTHNAVGLLLADLGRREDARAEYRTAIDIMKKLAQRFPATPAHQIELAGSYCNYGNLIVNEGQSADSLQWFELAIRTLRPVCGKTPGNATATRFLRNSYSSRAKVYDQLLKHTLAIEDHGQAIELSAAGDRPSFRSYLAGSLLRAGMAEKASVEIGRATMEVAELMRQSGWSASDLYDFACVYSIASRLIASQKEEHSNQAMELLRKAVLAGYRDATHVKKDTDLAPLRERDDFKKLFAELGKKAEKK